MLDHHYLCPGKSLPQPIPGISRHGRSDFLAEVATTADKYTKATGDGPVGKLGQEGRSATGCDHAERIAGDGGGLRLQQRPTGGAELVSADSARRGAAARAGRGHDAVHPWCGG